ncbi:MAG: alkaline phosphatase family protein, partial [Thermomicrobiaceae bacterium]|nr:alkaline phosphatase family protein [Thermomicrobiaceae bacterium]
MRALGEPRGRWPWIEEARLDGGGDRPPRVRPRYDGYGVANVPVTALAALGAPHDGVPLAPEVAPPDLLRGVRVVLLVIVDALGYAHLRRAFAAGDAPTLAAAAEEGSLAPITSTFPSTTAAALTTLQTAAPPARHGMLGFTTYLREFGVLLNLIRFTPVGPFESRPGGLDLDGFLPVPTIYQR